MKYFYRENPFLEELVDKYFYCIEEYNKNTFNEELSVILLGSLSRGEATWIENEDGFSIISDIEFFTVYPQGFDRFSEFTNFIEATAKEVFKDQKSSLFHIDNTFICRTALPKIERKLLTYDAKCMGKAVVGRDDIKDLPEISLKNINLWDIKDILTHRVFSVLYYGLPLKAEGNFEEYRYSLAKNSLDLMTVLLVCHGKLASGFVNRLEIVNSLPISEEIKDYFSYCISIKLSEVSKRDFTVEEMEKLFIYLIKELSKQIKVPLKNIFVNLKHVTRRVCGIVKRALIYRYIPHRKHLEELIKLFENQSYLTQREMKNNLVINGYPTIS